MQTAIKRSVDNKDNIGVFLSGGLDSSIIAALVNNVQPSYKSISVGFENADDLFYARSLAKHLDIEHFEYIYTIEEIFDILPQVIYHLESFDWSLVRSSIANYFASKLACENNIEFVLMGEGADELFGDMNI